MWSLDDALSDHWIQADHDAFVAGLNRALSGRGPQVLEVSERQMFPLIQCHAVDYSRGRFVLVGDAAHSIHPLAGQGINLGLSDAQTLGNEIVWAHQRGADWCSPQVFSRYERQRKGDNLGMMATMQAFKWGFGSKNPAVTLMRNIGLNRLMHFPWPNVGSFSRRLGLSDPNASNCPSIGSELQRIFRIELIIHCQPKTPVLLFFDTDRGPSHEPKPI